MRFHPTKIHLASLCFIFLSIILNLACSKDSDLLRDAIYEDQTVASVEEIDSNNSNSEEIEEAVVEEEIIDQNTDVTRTTGFPPINDAHVQSGKGYNQNLMRLEEDSRTGYLMFDLSPIAEISGQIKAVTLQFTINSDDGNGSIKIHKGTTNDWSEASLSEITAPELEVELGSITKEFLLDETEFIELNPDLITPEIYTLVLSHVGGNDIAFASKEHADNIGPKLVVTYETSEGSEQIIIEEVATENPSEDTTDPTEETTDTSQETIVEEQEPQNEEPMAIADANPSVGGAPLAVTFTGSNSSDDKEIVGYSWNFNDGTSSSTANPAHTFTEVGVYEVELAVTDAEGLTSTDKVTITVTEEQNNAPLAIVSATPISGEAPLAVSFKGSTSTDDHAIASYGWDFKDGSKTNVADFNYTYTTPGVYEAELTVTDENGLADKETITITVTESQNNPPVAIVGANVTSGNAPLQVQFLGSDSTDDQAVSSYVWDFKDGNTTTAVNPLYTFNQPGNYEVELKVSDAAGLTDTKSITITVTSVQNEAPVARIFTNITSGDVPLNVQFTGDQSSDDNAVSSYFWDFKDGSTANSANPFHTFNSTGNYLVELTVQDADGLSNTVGVNITVSEPVTNAPPGFYVATNGSSGNSGTSPTSPWSLEHAFNVAKAGDVVYVKAGNYGNKQLLTKNSGYGGSHIKFIGYRNSPGDINSSQGSTFNYGEAVDASKMPLLTGVNSSGTAFTLHNSFIHLENFQINGYEIGVLSIDNATNAELKNIIVTNSGNQYNANVYGGSGMSIRGNNTIIENCFILNAGSEAIKLDNSDYSKISYCSVYANNASNPTDYYYILADGTNNTVIENSRAERAPGLSHGGHGFNIKNEGSYNVIRNCTAVKTNFELTYAGVHHNTIEGGAIYGDNQWPSVMSIVGGAHDNLITGLLIQDTWTAITLATYDDRYGADAALGVNNTFENVTVKNTNRILNIGGGTNIYAKAKGYTFKNCSFENFEFLAVVAYAGEGFKFENCAFSNGLYPVTSVESYAPNNTLQASWFNCTWSNVNFNPPN